MTTDRPAHLPQCSTCAHLRRPLAGPRCHIARRRRNSSRLVRPRLTSDVDGAVECRDFELAGEPAEARALVQGVMEDENIHTMKGE